MTSSIGHLRSLFFVIWSSKEIFFCGLATNPSSLLSQLQYSKTCGLREVQAVQELYWPFFVFICVYTFISFTEKPKSFPLVLPLACGGVALLILVVVAVLCFVRHRSGGFSFEKKRREIQKRTKSQEIEVLRPENDLTDDPTVRQLQSLSQLVGTLYPKHQAMSKVLPSSKMGLDILSVFTSVQGNTTSEFGKFIWEHRGYKMTIKQAFFETI